MDLLFLSFVENSFSCFICCSNLLDVRSFQCTFFYFDILFYLTTCHRSCTMSNYEDDQSEDGELARSPVQDEMDFRQILTLLQLVKLFLPTRMSKMPETNTQYYVVTSSLPWLVWRARFVEMKQTPRQVLVLLKCEQHSVYLLYEISVKNESFSNKPYFINVLT